MLRRRDKNPPMPAEGLSVIPDGPKETRASLERILSSMDSRRRETLLHDPTAVERLWRVCDASPYLAGIMQSDPGLLEWLLIEANIEKKRNKRELLEELRKEVGTETGFEQFCSIVRRFKRKWLLHIGARDLCGMASLGETMQSLTDLAEAALQLAYEIAYRSMTSRYGTPYESGGPRGRRTARFVVLGMGKLGARELNFSSDIDLIYLYSSREGATDGLPPASSRKGESIPLPVFYGKVAEGINRAIGEPIEGEWVFRVDLGLRPGGKDGEMAQSLNSLLMHYENRGEAWERMALIKARPVAGDKGLGRRFLTLINPFVYSRSLDYTTLEDVRTIKARMQARSALLGGGPTIDVKLDPGGIRELEFFVQSLQIIFGGRYRALRRRGTVETLAALKDAGLLKAEEAEALRDAYCFLRKVEHRLQMVHQQQTHSLPAKQPERQRLARTMGFTRYGDGDWEAFSRRLESVRKTINSSFQGLLETPGERAAEGEKIHPLHLATQLPDAEAERFLQEMGFQNPSAARQCVQGFLNPAPPGIYSPRIRRYMSRAGIAMITEASKSLNPDRTLYYLDRFRARLGPREGTYALLAENPEVLGMLVRILGTSPLLSRILLAYPESLEGLILADAPLRVKPFNEIWAEVEALLSKERGYDDRLALLRRIRSEEMLRIGAYDLNDILTVREKEEQLSDLAEICLRGTVRLAEQYSHERLQEPLGDDASGLALMGLGRLGGREMSYGSDLDLIFLFAGEPSKDAGNRGGAGLPHRDREYFIRLGQRVISWISMPLKEGPGYRIDTRLRPSGTMGPLIVSLTEFCRYHQSSMVWEKQALLKFKFVAGDRVLGKAAEQRARNIIAGLKLPDKKIKEEVAEMAERIIRERRPGARPFHPKLDPGAMLDIEFTVQALQLCCCREDPSLFEPNTLKALELLQRKGLIPSDDFETLQSSYRFLRRLYHRLGLMFERSGDDAEFTDEELVEAAWSLGEAEIDDIVSRYRQATAEAKEIIRRLLDFAKPKRMI